MTSIDPRCGRFTVDRFAPCGSVLGYLRARDRDNTLTELEAVTFASQVKRVGAVTTCSSANMFIQTTRGHFCSCCAPSAARTNTRSTLRQRFVNQQQRDTLCLVLWRALPVPWTER